MMREMMSHHGQSGDDNEGNAQQMPDMMRHMMEMREKMMKNGGCPMMRKFCKKQQQQDSEQLPEQFRADPARAAAVEEQRRQAEAEEQARVMAEKQKRFEEIERKKVELAEQKFQLAALRESVKKAKKELKSMKKQDKKQGVQEKKKFRDIQMQEEQMKQLSKSTSQKCKEVVHLDLAETAVLKPGISQLKTWKVKNTGNTIWDDSTVAMFVKGNKSMIVSGFEKVRVGAVEPGHVAYIRVMFNIPQEAGDYSVTYRLASPVNGRFGKPLRSSVTVQVEEEEFVDSPPASAMNTLVTDLEERSSDMNILPSLIKDEILEGIAEQVVSDDQPQEPAFKFPEELKALLAFGFPEDACKQVLLATGGNVEQAVNMLLG